MDSVNGGYRSIDGGASWHSDPNLRFLTSLWFDLNTPGWIYATTAANALKSTDDGLTWAVLPASPEA